MSNKSKGEGSAARTTGDPGRVGMQQQRDDTVDKPWHELREEATATFKGALADSAKPAGASRDVSVSVSSLGWTQAADGGTAGAAEMRRAGREAGKDADKGGSGGRH